MRRQKIDKKKDAQELVGLLGRLNAGQVRYLLDMAHMGVAGYEDGKREVEAQKRKPARKNDESRM